MQTVLRRYREGDLHTLWLLDEQCFAPKYRFDRAMMQRMLQRRGALILIAEQDHDGTPTVCGFVIVHLEGRAQALCGYVVTLDVDERSRRHGVAAQLMAEVERRTLKQQALWMGLHVAVDNAGAIAFYERTGYVRGERIADFYGEAGMDAWVYRKWLGA